MEITNNAKCFSPFEVGWVKHTQTPQLAPLDCGTLVCPQSNLYLYPLPLTEKGVSYKLLSTFYDTIGTIGKGKIISRTVSIV